MAKETRGEITGFVHRGLRFEQTTGTVTPDVGHGFERTKYGDSASGVGRVDSRLRAFERASRKCRADSDPGPYASISRGKVKGGWR